MFGRWPRSRAQRSARSSRKSYAFTTAAFDGRGVGGVSIQWLIWNSEPAVPPRFGRHDSSDGRRARYGVSWIEANAGYIQSTPDRPDSRNVTTRWRDAAISSSVGQGGRGAPWKTRSVRPLSPNAAAISSGST